MDKHTENIAELHNEPSQLPQKWTPPYLAYRKAYRSLLSFVKLILETAMLNDTMKAQMAIALRAIDQVLPPAPASASTAEKQSKASDRVTHKLMSFEPLICEMMLARSVDDFLTYVSDLLALVFATRPQAMSTSEAERSERLDFILQFQSMGDLISAIAEKRVQDLSYQGVRQLTDYLSRRLDFALFSDQESLSQVEVLVEMRNLITHNHGIVNRLVKRKYPSFPGSAGEKIDLNIIAVTESVKVLSQYAAGIDECAIAKFSLACRAIES